MKITDSAHRISELLNLTGDSQNDFSIKTHIPKSTVSRYVNGEREPKQDKLSMIADAYNVNPAWLMGFDVPMESIDVLQKKMVEQRLEFLSIDADDQEALNENEKKFKEFKEKYTILSSKGGTGKSDTIEKALDFMQRYEDASPEVQAAIRTLLKVPQ